MYELNQYTNCQVLCNEHCIGDKEGTSNLGFLLDIFEFVTFLVNIYIYIYLGFKIPFRKQFLFKIPI